MTLPQAERLTLEIPFDLELFLVTSQERRIGGAIMDRMMALWSEWESRCSALRFQVEGRGYLLVWLDESVERAVDEAWEASPSGGFQAHALAQTLCMAAVHGLIPEIAHSGCAPSPRPGAALQDALKAADVPYVDKGPALSRRYAVLTPMPFRGGCEICSMISSCPKGQGLGGDAYSILLPGYEPGALL